MFVECVHVSFIGGLADSIAQAGSLRELRAALVAQRADRVLVWPVAELPKVPDTWYARQLWAALQTYASHMVAPTFGERTRTRRDFAAEEARAAHLCEAQGLDAGSERGSCACRMTDHEQALSVIELLKQRPEVTLASHKRAWRVHSVEPKELALQVKKRRVRALASAAESGPRSP